MDNDELILATVLELKEDVNKVLTDHEQRIRTTEASILKFKTLGTAITSLTAFFGWDAFKHHFLK